VISFVPLAEGSNGQPTAALRTSVTSSTSIFLDVTQLWLVCVALFITRLFGLPVPLLLRLTLYRVVPGLYHFSFILFGGESGFNCLPIRTNNSSFDLIF
jgi:hypothetical protein